MDVWLDAEILMKNESEMVKESPVFNILTLLELFLTQMLMAIVSPWWYSCRSRVASSSSSPKVVDTRVEFVTFLWSALSLNSLLSLRMAEVVIIALI